MFKGMGTEYIKIVAPVLHKCFVLESSDTMNMSYVKENSKRFVHHPHALYPTDVMFQQSNRPCGNMIEAKPYASSKHTLHAFKKKASASPSERCFGFAS